MAQLTDLRGDRDELQKQVDWYERDLPPNVSSALDDVLTLVKSEAGHIAYLRDTLDNLIIAARKEAEADLLALRGAGAALPQPCLCCSQMQPCQDGCGCQRGAAAYEAQREAEAHTVIAGTSTLTRASGDLTSYQTHEIHDPPTRWNGSDSCYCPASTGENCPLTPEQCLNRTKPEYTHKRELFALLRAANHHEALSAVQNLTADLARLRSRGQALVEQWRDAKEVRRHPLLRGLGVEPDSEGFEALSETEKAIFKACADALSAALRPDAPPTPNDGNLNENANPPRAE